MKAIKNTIAASFAAFALAGAPAARGADASWSGTAASGDWEDGDNWSTLSAPGSVGTLDSSDTASIPVTSTTRTLLPDHGRNISNLVVTSGVEYFIGPSDGDSNALTFTDKGGIHISGSGNQSLWFNAPLVMAGDMDINSAAGDSGKCIKLNGPSVFGLAAQGATNTLRLAGSNTGGNIVNAVISDGPGGGALAVEKNGAGQFYLGTQANTFSGGFTLNQGALLFRSRYPFGAGPLTINGGTLRNNSADLSIDITNSPVTIGGSFTVVYGMNQPFRLAGKDVRLAADAEITMGIDSWGSEFGISGDIKDVGGAHSITVKSGGGNTGYLNLTGSNSYAGGTILNGASLRIGSQYALGTGPFIINGGGLRMYIAGNNTPLAGVSEIIINNNFSASATSGNIRWGADIPVTLTNANVRMSIDNGTMAIYGPVRGDKEFWINGTQYSSSVHLFGANTLDGGFRLQQGSSGSITLVLRTPQALGSGPFTVGYGGGSGWAILNNDSGANMRLANDIPLFLDDKFRLNGSRSLHLGAGVATLGANVVTANVENAAATLEFGGPFANGDAAYNCGFAKTGPGAIALTSAEPSTHTGGTFVVQGTLRVSGAASLGTGDVAVNGGTLIIEHNEAIGNGAAVSIAAGAKLQLDNTAPENVGSVTINGSTYTKQGMTFGSSASGAMIQDDACFVGTGRLRITPEPASLLIIN